MADNYKRNQGIIVTFKTIFLLYIGFSFLIAYENLVIGDTQWGIIYSTIITFAVPYLVIDYFIALLRLAGVINDKKMGGVFILDLFIDQAPKFFTKEGFKPDKKGIFLAILIGVVLFAYFFGSTQATGTQYAGLPSFTGQISPLDKPTKSAMVAPFEDLGSSTLTSMIAITIYGIYLVASKGRKPSAKRTGAIMMVCLLIGAYGSSVYMAGLHEKVYKLNQDALDSVQKFFLVGNVVTAITGSQYPFDVFHGLWNYNVIQSGACIGSGCT